MRNRLFLSFVLLSAAIALPVASSAQSLKIDPNHFKVDKNKAKVHPHQAEVHPRRLAFNNKDGRHQPRVLSKSSRHTVRKNVRGVTHHATQPHHPTKS